MNNIIKKCRQSYGDMKLSYKFTLVLLLTATVPVVMMACFFYGKLYDMVVSYTIRQEQDTSAQTAPEKATSFDLVYKDCCKAVFFLFLR